MKDLTCDLRDMELLLEHCNGICHTCRATKCDNHPDNPNREIISEEENERRLKLMGHTYQEMFGE